MNEKLAQLAAKLVNSVKRNPVRYATGVVAAVLIAVSLSTGTPIAVLLVELAALVAAFEGVRTQVSPMVKVIFHEDDEVGDQAADFFDE